MRRYRDDVLQNSATIEIVVLVRASRPGSFLSMESLIQQKDLADEQLAILADRRPDPMQVAHMGPAGGTTGLPKVAPRTHNDYMCRVKYAARACEFNNHDICLVVAPASHDLTFSMAICLTMFTFGKLVMLESFEPRVVCETIEREKVTAIVWMPTLASRLIHFDGLRDHDLSSLKKMHCGGGVISSDLIKAVNEKLHCTFFNGYGGTEGMSLLTRPHYSLERVSSSVGRPTCPYDSYKIVDESGNELPPNTPGELIVKGPGIFAGYYKMPQENEKDQGASVLQLPERIEFVDEMPYTKAEKIDKQALVKDIKMKCKIEK